MPRFVIAFYLVTIALLPWSWFPPFSWLHKHAQWSDAAFAITALLWLVDRWIKKDWPRLCSVHLAMFCYFTAACFSMLLASPDKTAGALKLLGISELCALAFITSDLASRPRIRRAVIYTIAVTSLLAAVAAIAGELLFYAGVSTRLIGSYGDLIASQGYARAQAGFNHPNMLASFCIFAVAVVASDEIEIPVWLRRASIAALSIAVLLTFSRGILGFGLAILIRAARNRRGRLFAWGWAAGCVAAISFLTLWNLSFDPSRPLDAHIESAPSSRYETVTSSLETLAGNPLWGSGPGTSPGKYIGRPFDAHFTPLNIAATLGLPALMAFVCLIASLWLKRKRPIDRALWGGLAGLMLDGLAQDIEDFRHLWVIIGLAYYERKGSIE